MKKGRLPIWMGALLIVGVFWGGQATQAAQGPVQPPTTLTTGNVAPVHKSATTVAASPAGANYYVSRTGSNGDGLSWATAWNELNQINWSVIRPGDTILIDGGGQNCDFPVVVTKTSNQPQPAGCGMEYNTTLEIEASGTEAEPITIQLAGEPGRNGTARFFGGRSRPLPYCGQQGYAAAGGTRYGIRIYGRHDIVIDGTDWSGIMVYGNRRGIQLGFQTKNERITLRNIEVYDNGEYFDDPTGTGVSPRGDDLLFERLIVHDNGQDAFQIDGAQSGYEQPLNGATWRRVWLYNQRRHPTAPDEPFNYCSHSDGIQIYNSAHRNLLLEDSIVGPGFTNNIIFGSATFDNVRFRNSLVVAKHGSTNAIYSQSGAVQRNFSFDRITVVRDRGENQSSRTNTSLYGNGHTLANSMLVGGNVVTQGAVAIKTFCYNVLVDSQGMCQSDAHPLFTDSDYAGLGEGFADFDFTITNPAIPSDIGSSITSVAQLLDSVSPTASIKDLPSQSECKDLRLSWDGSDAVPGSGVKSFDVQVSIDAGAWTDWLQDTTAGNGVYQGGTYGLTVGFRVRARDRAGNIGEYSAARYTSIVDTISPHDARMGGLPRAQQMPLGLIWMGADSCGSVTFDVDYRDADSPTWIPWLRAATGTYAVFAPEFPRYGRLYTFRVLVRDAAGNSTESAPVSTLLAKYTVSGEIVTIRHEPVIWPQVTATGTLAADTTFGRYIAYLATEGDYDLLVARDGFGTLPPVHLRSVAANLSDQDFVLPPIDDAIGNGGFEAAGWDTWLPGGVVLPDIISGGHTGLHAVRLGGAEGEAWLQQKLSIPEGIANATLSFLVRLEDATAGHSTLAVDLAGTPISHTQLVSTTDWTHVWLPVEAVAGEVMTLTFTVSGSSVIWMDEVSFGSAISGGSNLQMPLIAWDGTS